MKRILLSLQIIFCMSLAANAQMLFHEQFVSGHSLGGGVTAGDIIATETSCGELKVMDDAGTNTQAGIFMTVRDSLSTTAYTIDMSTNKTVYVRARGAIGMNIGIRAREGSNNATGTVEQALTTNFEWEVLTFDLTGSFGAIDSTAISVFWVYLDKGTDGFLGDSAYIDYVAVGAMPDPAMNAYCKTDVESPLTGANLFQENADNPGSPVFSGSAAAMIEQDDSSNCGQVRILEPDPIGNPVGTFGQIMVFFDNANAIDVTGNAFVTIRAMVHGSTPLDIRIDMRDSTNNNTSNGSSGRITKTWPVNVWHTETYAYHPWNLVHSSSTPLDLTEIKALNLYFNTSTAMIDADSITFDYIAVGGLGSTSETGCVTGVKESELQGVSVYPTPTSGKAIVAIPSNGVAKVTVLSVTGSELFSVKGEESVELDLSSLPNGLYLLAIETTSGSTVKRLIKE